MALSAPYCAGRGPDVSTTVKVPVGLLQAARRKGWEPHLTVWCLCRRIAGPARQWTDREQIHRWVATFGLWSKSRLNALLKEGEGVFWTRQRGKRDGRAILYLKGLPRIVEHLTAGGTDPVNARWADLPLAALTGVAKRRGLGFEALVGRPEEKARPMARFSVMVRTGVPPTTQRRWQAAATTHMVPSFAVLGVVRGDYRIDRKYVPPSLLLLWLKGERVMVEQLGNACVSRFEAHRGRALQHALSTSGNLLDKGGSESPHGVRYTRDPRLVIKLREKGHQVLFMLAKQEPGKALYCYGAPSD